MFLSFINRILNKFSNKHNNHVIPEDKQIRTTVSFIRSFCTIEGDTVYYRGHPIDIRIRDIVSYNLKVGGDNISVSYSLNVYKDIYEVKRLLDLMIKDICERNFAIYKIIAIDAGVNEEDISHTNKFNKMVIKGKDDKDYYFNMSNVRDTALRLFQDQIKIIY